MKDLKPFFTPQPAEDDEIEIALEGIQVEMENCEPGDHTFYVLGDRMIYAIMDGEGKLQIYLGKIEKATEESCDADAALGEFEDMLMEGPVSFPRGKVN